MELSLIEHYKNHYGENLIYFVGNKAKSAAVYFIPENNNLEKTGEYHGIIYIDFIDKNKCIDERRIHISTNKENFMKSINEVLDYSKSFVSLEEATENFKNKNIL